MRVCGILPDDLDEIGAYLGQCNGCYALNEHDYPAAALALEFYKVALGAVEHTAMDAHLCAFCDVEFLGAQVGDILVCGCRYSYELLHLAVWDNDWSVPACYRAGMVLEKIDALFQFLDSLLCGVDKYHVVDCRHHSAALGSARFFNKCLLHWDETLYSFAVEELLCLEFAAVGRAHCEPYWCAVIVHG